MRLRLAWLATAVMLCACAPLPSIPDKPMSRPIPYRVTSAVYSTGLRVVVYEDAAATRAWLDVAYGVGTRDEAPQQAGIAHLVEHLTFRSRPRGPGTATLADAIRATGAPHNGETNVDSTDYFEVGLPEQLQALLELEAARMATPLAGVTDAAFLAERSVVMNELQLHATFSGSREQEDLVLSALLHAGDTSRLNQRDALGHLTLADAQAWAERNYAPDNAIVVVVSPRPAEETLKQVFDVFGKLGAPRNGLPVGPRGRASQSSDDAFEEFNGGALSLETHVDHPQAWLAWRLPGASSPEAVNSLAVVPLVQTQLARRFRGDKRVRSTRTNLRWLDDQAFLLVELTLRDAADADAVLAAARRLSPMPLATDRRGVPAEQVALVTEIVLERQVPPLQQIAQHLRACGRADFLGDWNQDVLHQLRSNLTPFFKELLRPEQARAFVLQSDGTGFAHLDRPEGTDGATEDDASWLDEDRGLAGSDTPPAAQAARVFRPGLDHRVRHTLGNGLKVEVLPWGGYPLVDMRLVLDANIPPKLRAAAAVGRLAAHPALGFGYDYRVGAINWLQRGDNAWVFGGLSHSGNLANLLLHPRVWLDIGAPEQGPAREARQRLDKRLSWRAEHAQDLVEPPPWEPPAVDRNAVATTTASQLNAWWLSLTRPENATLILVGDVKPDAELWTFLEDWLGHWSGGDAAPDADVSTKLPLPSERRIQFVELPKTSELGLLLRVAIPAAALPKPGTLDLLQNRLQARLEHQLREREGLTYGVSVGARALLGGAELQVSTFVDPPRADEALKQLLAGLEALRAAPMTDKELSRARFELVSAYAHQFLSVSSVASTLANAAIAKLPDDAWEHYPETLDAVGAADLQGTAAASSIGSEDILIAGTRADYDRLTAAGWKMRFIPRLPAPKAGEPDED
ncbi:MAG: insulinase family protein [Deltaproteobacteria bacterium]|nr:insulinase family protein [Deltaproteobacteria bacterium]